MTRGLFYIREAVGRRAARLVGYDVDGLVADAEMYAKTARQLRVHLRHIERLWREANAELAGAREANASAMQTAVQLRAERDEARALARKLWRERAAVQAKKGVQMAKDHVDYEWKADLIVSLPPDVDPAIFFEMLEDAVLAAVEGYGGHAGGSTTHQEVHDDEEE